MPILPTLLSTTLNYIKLTNNGRQKGPSPKKIKKIYKLVWKIEVFMIEK